MRKTLSLATLFGTIFLDFFNLGMIYPLFASLVFEGGASLFEKNVQFGLLISLFPLGQLLGAPIIGMMSDHYGRRKLLLFSLMGTVATLLVCALGIFASSFLLLFIGRFLGGLMAANMALAYAALADISSAEEKVKNFALVPLATGAGFSLGPFLAGLLAHPALPFLLAAGLSLVNLAMIYYFYRETKSERLQNQSFRQLLGAFRHTTLRSHLFVLFLMISANLVFVQFVGPFAIDRFAIEMGALSALYALIGVAVAIGHLFLTRRLRIAPDKALQGSLLLLATLLVTLIFANETSLYVLTFLIMLTCSVAYTNAMALVSNQASPERQGEVMGLAVSIQSTAEFLPALLLGLVSSLSQSIPIGAAALFALLGSLWRKRGVTQEELL